MLIILLVILFIVNIGLALRVKELEDRQSIHFDGHLKITDQLSKSIDNIYSRISVLKEK